MTLRSLVHDVIDSRLMHAWQAGRSRASLVSACLLLVAVVTVLDHFTGKYLAFSLFYLLPISLGAWAGGRRLGILLSVLCAVAWGWIDLIADLGYPHLGYEAWNASIRFSFFLITTLLLTGLRSAYQRERQLARVDPLTGALNRRSLMSELDRLVERARREGQVFSVGYCDLDQFKRVNDTRGHAAGDAVLCEVARVAAATLRQGEVFGRLGGDEFAVLLPGADEDAARERGERLRESWRAAMARGGWPTDVSLGLATFRAPPASAEAALSAADQLALAAKARRAQPGEGPRGEATRQAAASSRADHPTRAASRAGGPGSP